MTLPQKPKASASATAEFILGLMPEGKEKNALHDVFKKASAEEDDRKTYSHPEVARRLYENYLATIRKIAKESGMPFAEMLLGLVEPPAEVAETTRADIAAGCDPSMLIEYRRVSFYEEELERAIAMLNKHWSTLQISDQMGPLDKEKLAMVFKVWKEKQDGGNTRGANQTAEKAARHELIKGALLKLPENTPPHKINKEVAKLTGLEFGYVGTARREMKKGLTRKK